MDVTRIDMERVIFRAEFKVGSDPDDFKSMEVTHKRGENNVVVSFPRVINFTQQQLYEIGIFLIEMANFNFDDKENNGSETV